MTTNAWQSSQHEHPAESASAMPSNPLTMGLDTEPEPDDDIRRISGITVVLLMAATLVAAALIAAVLR